MKFKRRPLRRVLFDMTPMIDIVFLLIIFFMVTSTFIQNRGIKVNLPKSTTSQSETKNFLIVTIGRTGRLFLNQNAVTERELGIQLKAKSIEMAADTVIIKGDESVPYAKMVRVMDIAKMAGLSRISLSTDRK